MAAARPLRIRSLRPADLASHASTETFFDLLQLLIAHGDHEFVASLHDSARHRVDWLIERDADQRQRNTR